MATSAIDPRKALSQMLVGNQIQQAIYVAAKLGIADLLIDGPQASEALAQASGAHPRSLYRLLRALASFGVFRENEDNCFELTPIGSLLRHDAGGAARAFALWSGGVSYQTFGGLEFSVMNGRPAFEQIYGLEFFDYLNQTPETGNLFDELMSWHTAPLAPIVAAYDFSGVHTIVDLGGGRGELMTAILSAHSRLRGILVDHTRVVPSARRVLKAAGVEDRCTILCGDIVESVPCGGDMYILKSVVHGLDDKTAVLLLKNCAQAMNKGARLLLIEFIMPPGNEPFPAKLMDLLMLVGCYGSERSAAEFHSLFAAAGFRLTSITTTKYGYSLIEGACA